LGKMQYWDAGMDSFGNVYKGADGKYYSFVGSGMPGMTNDEQWVNGLLWTDDPLSGKWQRYEGDTHPTFVYSENPYVFEYVNSKGQKVYFTVYDDLVNQRSIGFGWSYDGYDWKYNSIDLSGYANWSGDTDLMNTIRTPCCLLYDKAADNYVIIFTAFGAGGDRGWYASIGRVAVKIEEITPENQPSVQNLAFPGDMRDWQTVTGGSFVQYGREFSLEGRKSVNGSANQAIVSYAKEMYNDVTVEGTLYFVEPSWNHAASAGVYARADKDGAGGYRAYLTASNNAAQNKVQLYAGDTMIKETVVNKKPGIHRTLKIEADGNFIKVYYEGTEVISVTDSTYASGYCGLIANASHWHFTRVEINKINK